MRMFTWLVIAFVYGFVGCIPKIETPSAVPGNYSANYWGNVSALRQGDSLQNARIAAVTRTPCNADAFDITVTEFNEDGSKLTTFTFCNLPKKICTQGKFKVDYQSLYCRTDTVGSTFTALSKQMPWGTYKPLISRQTQVTIQKFDTLSGEIRGTFSVLFVPDDRRDAVAPDLIQITAGKFVTKLMNKNGSYK